MVLYKARKIRLLCCSNFGTIVYSKADFKGVVKFEKFWRISCIVFYGAEVLITAVDLLISLGERNSTRISTNLVQSELENPALDIIQILLTFIVIY